MKLRWHIYMYYFLRLLQTSLKSVFSDFTQAVRGFEISSKFSFNFHAGLHMCGSLTQVTKSLFALILASQRGLHHTVEPPCATTSRKRPPPTSNQRLINYSKHQVFPGQSPMVGTSCKRPPFVSDRDHLLRCRIIISHSL